MLNPFLFSLLNNGVLSELTSSGRSHMNREKLNEIKYKGYENKINNIKCMLVAAGGLVLNGGRAG